jgi:hypothetical protein
LMAVVVLPTPPFWLATAMTRPMILLFVLLRVRICERVCEINARFLCNFLGVFHVEHSNSFAQPPGRWTVGLSNCEGFRVKHIVKPRLWDDCVLQHIQECFT